jgi:hypothetical protein
MIIRPNPNTGNFTIELIYVTNKTKIEIFDQFDKLVFESPILALETELYPCLPIGNYEAKILENKAVISIQKLIIQ